MPIELIANLENHKRRIWSICWSPDGNLLASVGSDRYIIIWKKKHKRNSCNKQENQGYEKCKDAEITNYKQKNKIEKKKNETVLKKFELQFVIDDIIETKHMKSLRHIEFSKDGSFFVVASFDSKCSIFKKNKYNKWIFSGFLKGHENEVKCVAIHHLSKYIITCGRDRTLWLFMRVYENKDQRMSNKSIQDTKGTDRSNKALLFSNESRFEKINDDKSTEHEEKEKKDGTNSSGNEEEENEFNFHFVSYFNKHKDDIKFVSWCPLSENMFVSLCYDNTIKIWNKEGSYWDCVQTLEGHSSIVWCVSFNHDGTEFATCSDDKTIRIWESTKKKNYNKKMYPFLYGTVFDDFIEEEKRNSTTVSEKDTNGNDNEIDNDNENENISLRSKENINNNNNCNDTFMQNTANDQHEKNSCVQEYTTANNRDHKGESIKMKENKKKVRSIHSKLVDNNNNNNNNTQSYIVSEDIDNLNKDNEQEIIYFSSNPGYTSEHKLIPIYFQYGIFKFVYKFSRIKGEIRVGEKIEKEIIQEAKENIENNITPLKEIVEDQNINDKFDDWKVKYVIEGYHKRSISYIDWNCYENLLAAASYDNSLKIFEKKNNSWQLIEDVENAHITDVNCVVWCPTKYQNYSLLATAGDDCVINIWKFEK